VLVGAVAFAVLCIPFLTVYLPKVSETGGHTFREAGYYLTLPDDLINVGPDNLLWGWIHRLLALAIPPKYVAGEHEDGLPLVLFVLLVLAMRPYLRRRTQPLADGPEALLRALALSLLVSWLLTLQLGPLSPWRLVYWLVPGARGLRTVVRYQMVLSLPSLILIVVALAPRWNDLRRARPVLAGALVALLLAETVNGQSAAELSRSTHFAQLSAVPRPPASCRSFYVVKARRAEPAYKSAKFDGLYPHNVDAMYLAQVWRVPTPNGFSTFTPSDWAFADPLAGDYDARALAYAVRHDLHGFCRLDMRQPTPWTMARP
jgi:hypothetical protein